MGKNINYTDAAVQKLDTAIAKLKKDIEKDIVKSKNYPGEDVIEITASDIEDAFDRVTIKTPKAVHSKERSMLFWMTLFLHIIAVLSFSIIAIVSEIDGGNVEVDENMVLALYFAIVIPSLFSVLFAIIWRHLKRDKYQMKMMEEIFDHYMELRQKQDRLILEKEIEEIMCNTIEKDTSSTSRATSEEEEGNVSR